MKKGMLAVVMAAVAALFLVEVSMEELFVHRRLQQTMAESAVVQDAPEILTVVVTGQENAPDYLLLCGRVGQELRLCSLEPDTQIPNPQGGMTTLRQLGAQKGIRTLVASLSDVLGVKTGSYLAVDSHGIGQLVDKMGGVALSDDQGQQALLTGQQAEALLAAENGSEGHPELSLFRGMLRRIGGLPRNQLLSLAVQGMKCVKTNVSLREILEQGASLLGENDAACQSMALPGTIPAVWSGAGEKRHCSYDLGQAAEKTMRFFAGK